MIRLTVHLFAQILNHSCQVPLRLPSSRRVCQPLLANHPSFRFDSWEIGIGQTVVRRKRFYARRLNRYIAIPMLHVPKKKIDATSTTALFEANEIASRYTIRETHILAIAIRGLNIFLRPALGGLGRILDMQGSFVRVSPDFDGCAVYRPSQNQVDRSRASACACLSNGLLG